MKQNRHTTSSKNPTSAIVLMLTILASGSVGSQIFEDGFEALADGDCTMIDTELKMLWSSCFADRTQ
jgi:hypothetical protein